MDIFNYELYFDDIKHRYYDNFNNPLVSTTTIIGKYEHKFDTELMARNCWKAGINGNPKYRGKSVEQIKREWKKDSDDGLAQGNEKHNFLEVAIKDSSYFYNFHSRYPGNNYRLYTIPDILNNPKYGELSINTFIDCGIKDRYPSIFDVIVTLTNKGYRIYSEIGTFNIDLLVTGLIDVLLVKDKSFIILDWKTNKAPIRFDSGYWEKDKNGKLTNNWITQNYMFEYPINKLQSSVGNKFALQLSTYAYQVIQFGLKLEALILCQIIQKDKGLEEVNIDLYPVLLNEVELMLKHHVSTSIINKQHSLVF